MTLPRPVRVVGVGSPLGDDALAWEVVGRLREQAGADVELHRLEGGQRLLDVLDGRGSLVLVDALTSGATPGTIRRFSWPDPSVESLRPGSTHDMNPAEALRLAQALGMLPRRVIVFGIEAGHFGPEPGLSLAVSTAVPELVRRIAAELGTSGEGTSHA